MFTRISNFIFLDFVGSKLYSYLIKYPTPINLNYMWGFGSMAGLFLVIQILSGFFLTMFYVPHIDYAFNSIEHIMRDVNYGWLIRYIHSNGASFFFFVIYLHILKGLYYGSYQYPRHIVWFSGIIIYILMMGTAFLGYVLPWGQMSYWAATVITNMVTVIPYFGKDIVYWVWGGYAINNATLARFFSLHYILPFVIAVLAVYHILQLHKMGSGNELGIKVNVYNKISFFPYFIIKDLFGISLLLILYSFFLFFLPEKLGHSDNYIMANPLVTPSHIVPEWYFLPFYGILRSILDKTYGIIIMFASMLILFFLPVLDKSLIRTKTFKVAHRILFWVFVFNFAFLGYLGGQAPVSPYIELGVIGSHIHLLYFVLFLPTMSLFDSLIKFIRIK
jgi:ubiquinol-cytochrome c reductase cytochrome b subunit